MSESNKNSIEQLQAENEALKRQLRGEMRAVPDHLKEHVRSIKGAGLAHDAAIDVAQRQFENDEAQRAEAEGRANNVKTALLAIQAEAKALVNRIDAALSQGF
jgi:hypothetical protein